MPSSVPYKTVPENIPCSRCGYNLRGLLPEERCPECGALVTESLRQPTLHCHYNRRLIRIWLLCLIIVGLIVLLLQYF
ncbi:MAG: hypothetical protein ACYSU7_10040 [Planctomycetota bacterium]|jgi:hypothetical protein